MSNNILTSFKQVEAASFCIDIYTGILKEKLTAIGKIKDESDLLVEIQSDYDTMYLLLSHIADKVDEITEAVNKCK